MHGSDIHIFADVIEKRLGISCSALSGANIASEVALERFSETTVGYRKDKEDEGLLWQKLFGGYKLSVPEFGRHAADTRSQKLPSSASSSSRTLTACRSAVRSRTSSLSPRVSATVLATATTPSVSVQKDTGVIGTSVGPRRVVGPTGAVLKGWALVQTRPGLCSPLQIHMTSHYAYAITAYTQQLTPYTAAIMRIGLLETKNFCLEFFNDVKPETFLQESAGVADLITSCLGGRNRKTAEAFVTTGKPFDVLEREMLGGQSESSGSRAKGR